MTFPFFTFITVSLLCLVGLVQSFSMDTQSQVTAFANVPLRWTRNSSDPSGFWLNNLRTDVSNGPKKVLSVQVDNSGASSGTANMVFIQEGVYIVVAVVSVSSGENDFFTSPPMTVVAAPTASCNPVSSALSSTTSPTSTSSNAGNNSSPQFVDDSKSTNSSNAGAIAGGTIGGFVLGVVLTALIALLMHRRSKALVEKKGGFDQGVDAFPGHSQSALIGPSSRTSYSPQEKVFRPNQQEVFRSNPSSDNLSTSARGNGKLVSELSYSNRTGASSYASSTMSPTSAHATERQRIIADEADRLRVQILGMVNQVLSTSRNDAANPAEVERLKAQVRELEAQRDSEWARGLTDEPPAYFASHSHQDGGLLSDRKN